MEIKVKYIWACRSDCYFYGGIGDDYLTNCKNPSKHFKHEVPCPYYADENRAKVMELVS